MLREASLFEALTGHRPVERPSAPQASKSSVTCADALRVVKGDPLLDQALLSVVLNAEQAIGPGGDAPKHARSPSRGRVG